MHLKQIAMSCVIVAAGSSRRMKGQNKLMLEFDNKLVIEHTIINLQKCEDIKEIIIVTSSEDAESIEKIAKKLIKNIGYKVVAGGKTRQQSAFNGVRVVSDRAEYISIHDGARPFINAENVSDCFKLAQKTGAATLGIKVKDTIKIVDDENLVKETPDRNKLYAIQTPQIFETGLYFSAMKKAELEKKDYTDDCQLVETMGVNVMVCNGSYDNIKITTTEDMYIAEAIVKYRKEGLNAN